MVFNKQKLTNLELVKMYKSLLLPRLIEKKMLILLRQGKISKWFSGWGQEAISVGTTLALDEDEYILSQIQEDPAHKCYSVNMDGQRRIKA